MENLKGVWEKNEVIETILNIARSEIGGSR